MGNRTSVSSPRKLDYEAVDAQIREINERRFGGYFVIKRSTPDSWVGPDGWEFWCDAWDKSPLFGYYLTDTKRKIQGGHPKRAWQWANWAVAVFENELGAAWKGRISDEGVEGSWAPVATKYPTFREWMAMWLDGTNEEFKEQWKRSDLSEIPRRLRPFALPEIAEKREHR